MAEQGAKLLVVDDEPNIVELLSASLRYAGFEVSSARSGREAVDRIREVRPDLVILDVLMPGVDGLSVLRQLRANGIDVPVLFLTAKDAHEDRIAGLTLGADDYVPKPFSLAEVIARIHAILRRAGRRNGQPSARLSFADIELDDDSHEVWKAGRAVSLSPTEFKLLRYFLVNPGRALSKAQILDHVWAYDFGGEANVVESYVSYLRRKIDTTEPKLLHVARGRVRTAAPAVTLMTTPVLDAGRWRELRDRTPLRTQLVAAVLLLAAVAVVVTSVLAAVVLRDYLLDRVDAQLRQSAGRSTSNLVETSVQVRGRVASVRRPTTLRAGTTTPESCCGVPVWTPPPAFPGRIFRRWTATPWTISMANLSRWMPPTATAPGESSPWRRPEAAASWSAFHWTMCQRRSIAFSSSTAPSSFSPLRSWPARPGG